MTTVCAMPNLDPVPDSPEKLQPELDAIAKDAVIKVYPYGSISVDEAGQQLAWDYLLSTERLDGLYVTVKGRWDGDTIKVISIEES